MSEEGSARGGSAPPAAELQLVAGRYAIDGVLGKGGMGAVYRAFDQREQRSVALKTLRLSRNQDKLATLSEMFHREYRTLAQLSHPSVIEVYEYGVADEGPYYTMELLDGGDLHAAAPLGWREACARVRDVCSCLALLHSRRLLHRDVSPRNVRCTRDGGAKLIDFGAMVPMGTTRHVVGTPPLVPPEAVNGQPLDGRYDLYALGATLYWALTGRHAFPARALADLVSMWRFRPVPPSALVPGVPEALDDLVLSLLSADIDARPRSAAEVMVRLGAIAGFDDAEDQGVLRSYLTTPMLLGRERELARVREALATAKRGRGTLLWLEGDSGMGRTRLLDACVVEARLQGITVLRAGAHDASAGERGVLAGLVAELQTAFPGVRVDALRKVSSRPPPRYSTPPVPAGTREFGDEVEYERVRLLDSMRAALRGASSSGPLLCAIDDLSDADATAQAVIAALVGDATRRGIVFLLSTREIPREQWFARLQGQRQRLTLGPLSEDLTEALLGSVFGDVPGLAGVAARVHALSQGNPRITMELAQHLVDSGRARYELGGWALPQRLDDHDLPSSWTEVLDARLGALSTDARELAEAMACAADFSLELGDFAQLTSHHDVARCASALDELLAAQLAQVTGGHCTISGNAYRERLTGGMPAERARAVQLALADWLASHADDRLDVVRCLQRAGESGRAIDQLLAELEAGSRWDTSPPDYVELLTESLAACDSLGRRARDRFLLLRELVKVGDHLGLAGMPAFYAELFAQLCPAFGHDVIEALPKDMDPMERIQHALRQAQERHDAQTHHERVFSPVESLISCTYLVRQAAAFGAVAMDYELIESLPKLDRFASLSPALRTTVEHTVPACLDLTAGRFEAAREHYQTTLERLLEPDHAGLDDETWVWGVHALRFALGHLNAGLGIDAAMRYADDLEQHPAWVIPAWDVRRAAFLRRGDLRNAELCRERIERILLETGRRPPMVDTSARLELDTCAHADDLIGVRRAQERLQPMMDLHSGFAPYKAYGAATYERVRGNNAQALEHIESALAAVEPGRHPTWPWIASCHLQVLLALGRFEDARRIGLSYAQAARDGGMVIMAHHVEVPLALAEAKLGDIDGAIRRTDEAIAYREELGCRGLNLGWAYEHRARLAILAGDAEGFERAAEACAREYGKGTDNSALVAKHARLCEEARRAGVLLSGEHVLITSTDRTTISTLSDFVSRATSELTAEVDFGRRCSRALSLLLEASGASVGALYRYREGQTELLASTWRQTPPQSAELLAQTILSAQEETATCTEDVSCITREGGSGMTPVVLGCYRGTQFRGTGVAVLQFANGPTSALPLALVEAIGSMLGDGESTSL